MQVCSVGFEEKENVHAMSPERPPSPTSMECYLEQILSILDYSQKTDLIYHPTGLVTKEDRGLSFEKEDRGLLSFEKEDRGLLSFEKEDRGLLSFEKEDRGLLSFEKEDRGLLSFEKEDRGLLSFEKED
ncbi:hypothetical protein CDAR_196911 [Caerostris darwini]|uniref:Uncharacterized protein n=1 Tax=Caerostris darwini TaxID=1538125 RepID=A0AAV4PVR1_9ARAC|nr:hypothetical protein CDAR_196911 [Caerostris darwini]